MQPQKHGRPRKASYPGQPAGGRQLGVFLASKALPLTSSCVHTSPQALSHGRGRVSGAVQPPGTSSGRHAGRGEAGTWQGSNPAFGTHVSVAKVSPFEDSLLNTSRVGSCGFGRPRLMVDLFVINERPGQIPTASPGLGCWKVPSFLPLPLDCLPMTSSSQTP